MQIFNNKNCLSSWLRRAKQNNKTIGFIPTMGALHSGHISLVNKSIEQNDLTICSVFVNPTQFDNKEDLVKYPKDVEKDSNLLKINNCDAVFFPTIEDMYPEKEEAEHFEFGGIEHEMEGKFRDGHFDGVATIVSRFFELIQPTRAYFGEKDFQQLRIIQELVKQKKHGIEIVPMPIFREESGLAMSSRNTRLTPHFVNEAPNIYRILNLVNVWKTEFSVNETLKKVEDEFQKTDLKLEYFMLCSEETLKPINRWNDTENVRAFIACYAGKIRLIDNLKIT